MDNVRYNAALSLLKCEKDGKYSNIELDSAIKKSGFQGLDRSFFTVLFYGVVERKITLDYVISAYSSRKTEELDREVLTLLRLGAYQILFMDSVPVHAAVNETVELCGKFRKRSAASFVNAVLRRIGENKDKIKYPDDKTEFLSVYYSFPVWLCKKWTADYGYEKCRSVLESFGKKHGMTLRVNTLRTDRESVKSTLEKRGINAEYGHYSDSALILPKGTAVTGLEELDDGLVFVEDEASQLCAYFVGANEGDAVADVCSCPGGKSFSMAMEMNGKGNIYSFDIHSNKLSLVRKGAEKLGIGIIKTSECDARTPKEELFGKIDCVLADVPCSGLGVMAKKPDLRYKDKDSLERLPEIQYEILSASSLYVKNGGTLVYSTCTLNKDENEKNVARFLEEHPEFTPVEFEKGNVKSENGMLTFFPDEYETDGFFVAKMKKLIY